LPSNAASSVKRMPFRTRIVHVRPPSAITGSASAVFGTTVAGDAR
jgi:hypothetical protein